MRQESRRLRVSAVFVLALMLSASTAMAGDIWPQDVGRERLESVNQISVGLAFRLDEKTGEEHRPNLSVQYLRFLTDYFALRAEVGYTPPAHFGYKGKAQSVTTAIGLRLGDRDGFIAPYVEADFGIWRLSGDVNGREYRETYPAIGAGVGLAIKSGKSDRFDVGFRLVLNDWGASPYVVTSPSLPPEPPTEQYFYGPWIEDRGDDLLNLPQFFVRYRFGI